MILRLLSLYYSIVTAFITCALAYFVMLCPITTRSA